MTEPSFVKLRILLVTLLTVTCGEAREILIEPEPELMRAFIRTDHPSYPQYNPKECWTDSAWNIYISLFVINVYDETLEDLILPDYELEVRRDIDTALVKSFRFSGVLQDTLSSTLMPGDTARINQLSPIFWFQQFTNNGVGHITPASFEFANPIHFTITGNVKFFDRIDPIEIEPYGFRVFFRLDGCP